MKKYSTTSPENYDKYRDTGNNKYLNDIDLRELKSGDSIIISWEGGEKEIDIA